MKKLAELSKKTFAMLIIVMLVISIIPNTGITEAVATEDYRSWSQADSRWGSLTLGSGPNTMSSSGCLVTSLAKMMIQANIKDTSWTPASMRNWLMSNNLLDYYGSVTSYAAIANISSDLNFIKTIDLQCNWTLDKSTILSLANQNYQIILSVKGGAASGTHFVLVDNKLSVTNNDVYIMDTSKTISYNVGKIASSRYNYANKCVVFYSNQNVAPIVEKTDLGTDFYAAIINTERNKALTVETNNNNNIAMYTYTGAPNQIWHFTKNNDASYRITSCYNGESMDVCGGSSASWVNVVTWTSNDTGAQKWSFYGNAPYMFISPECNSGVLDVADAKYEDGTNICINVKTGHDAQLFNVVKVNPPSVGEMTYPTIMFDTDSYTVGDTVNFSWAKTSANTDFYQYWVVVHNATTGKSYYSGATGDSGDVTKNTLSFVADAEGEYTITVYAVPHNNKEERQKWDTKSITVLTHSHSYIATITKKATCSEFGIKTYTCTCGKSYTETLSKSNNHSNLECVSRSGKFASVWTYKCSDCGDEYTYDFGVKNATATVISNNEVAVNIEFFNDDVEPRNHYVEYMAVSNANPEGIMSLYGGQKTYEEFSDKHYYAVFFYFEESLKEKIGDKHCIFIGVQNKTNPKNYSGMVKVEYDWPQGKYFYLKSGETLDLNEALFSDKSSGVLGYSLKKYDTNVIDYKDGVCTAKKTGRAYMVFINNKTGEIRGGTIVVQCEKHNLLETETVSPTCTKNGIKMYDCKNCDYTYTETIAKLGHKYSSSYTIDKKATCSAEGSKSKHCTRSGCTAKTSVTAIAKLAHTYDNNCDKTCNVCKATRSISHSYKNVTTNATLSKNGKVETKCAVCGYVSKTTTVYYPKTIKLSATSYTYNGKTKTPTVTVKDSKGNTLKKDADYTITYASGRKNTGKYSVTVTFKGKYSGTKTLYFNILPSKTSKITPTCATTSIKASWKKVTGASGYKVELLNSKGKVVKSATTTKTAYTFKSLSKVTTYKVRVTAYKTIDSKKVYSTSYTTITTSTAPAKVTLSKVSAGSKSATPTWKKVSGVSGYEVMYSTSSKFSSSKTATVSKGSSTKTTIKKLTKGKKYYFKVRAYKTVDGKKIYSAWSAVKNVKVK